MSLELVLFLIFAVVAIFTAAMMLVSRNAVHSALFLVTNFICVAFFYLLLNAPFLAMIQITVYAGAIMVLFIFVIMLLGAEKLSDEEPKFPWLAPAAVGLATILLIMSFVLIDRQYRIGGALFKPVVPDPQIRVVHAVQGVPAVDVYLNNDRVIHEAEYREPTPLTLVKAGEYNLLVFAACHEADPAKCPDPIKTGAKPLVAAPVKLQGGTQATTFVIGGTADTPQLLNVPMEMAPLEDEANLRVTAVNALPGGNVNFVKINTGLIGQLDQNNQPRWIEPLASDLGPESPTKTLVLPNGTYSLAWYRGTEQVAPIGDLALRGKTHELLILSQETPAGATAARPTVIHIEPAARVQEAFGSPQQIGLSMLSAFLLPFEVVSLLLLAAMVGAIILTREEVAKRVRQRLVVSPIMRRVNRALTPNPDALSTTNPNPEAGSSSAD
jgi:NADH:ubiquinone oxidoreductase subunit 6 (subunit J)